MALGTTFGAHADASSHNTLATITLVHYYLWWIQGLQSCMWLAIKIAHVVRLHILLYRLPIWIVLTI